MSVLASIVCGWMGHKWQRGKRIPDLRNNMKRCARCGLIAPVKPRKPKQGTPGDRVETQYEGKT